MSAERVLILGATGYVGGRLVPRLLEAGYAVRCLVRTPGKVDGLPWARDVEVVAGDLATGEGVGEAFADVDVVYHLVHSMGSRGGGLDFAALDRRIALRVAQSAERAGVRRIVYLGGLGEVDEDSSEHLRSRAEVGDILLAGGTPVTALRAAVIIGSGSASFEMLRHLVEKLPVMVTPRWVHTRVQPIAIRDVLRYLVGVIAEEGEDDHVYDIGGPDVLTYLEMMRAYARVAGLRRRVVVPVPVLSPKLSSHWVGLVTPVPTGVAKPLVASLTQEVVVRPDGEDVREVVPGPTIPYVEALGLALRRIRDREVQTSWRDAELADRSPAEPYPGDPAWTGGTLLSDEQETTVPADAASAFIAVSAVGGDRGWPTHRWAWALRGWLDHVVGGVGLRRGRRDPDVVRVGDALDFWRVEDVREPEGPHAGLLRLRAEMKLPGRAWLEWRIHPLDGRSRIEQRALFAPRGIAGRLYWWAMLPFHAVIFRAMVERLGEAAVTVATSTGGPRRRPGAHGASAA